MRWLARLWPRSLVGQLMLATALALFVAQAVNFAFIQGARSRERGALLAAASAASIAESIDRLSLGIPLRGERRFGEDDEREERGEGLRRRIAERLRDDPGGDGPMRPRIQRRRITVGAQPDFAPAMTDVPALAAQVAHLLEESDVPVLAVRAAQMPAHPGPRVRDGIPRDLVAVAAELPDRRWITVRARVADRSGLLRAQLLGQTALLFGLLLLPLLWIARRVARPLSALAAAANATAPGRAAPDLIESGPEDVRAVTREFNDLRRRIRAMLADKDRMLGAMGHDLRTPLASLRVRVEQVADAPLREAMATTISDMATMLEDIVALARAGHPSEPPVPTDLAALIDGVVADYRAMERPVRLAGEGAVLTIATRPVSLRRAVRNLIDNAVSYGGSATVGVDRDGATAVIWVEDQGPGIPPERIAELTEAFARAEESRNRETGGAGLGLALAKAIALAEGGELRLANRATGGLRAELRLPISVGQT